jgi:hypothetical protein
LQGDFDQWIARYNHEQTYQGKLCCGRTATEAFEDEKKSCQAKMIS